MISKCHRLFTQNVLFCLYGTAGVVIVGFIRRCNINRINFGQEFLIIITVANDIYFFKIQKLLQTFLVRIICRNDLNSRNIFGLFENSGRNSSGSDDAHSDKGDAILPLNGR